MATVLVFAATAAGLAQEAGSDHRGGQGNNDLVTFQSNGLKVTPAGPGTYALQGTPQTQVAMGNSTSTTVTTEVAVQPGHPGGTSPGRTLKFTAPPGFQPEAAYDTKFGTVVVFPHDPTGAWGHPGQFLFLLPPEGTGPTPPTISGRYNVHTTRRDWRVIAHQTAEGIWQTPPVPVVGVEANPAPALTGLPTWYWLSGYSNQVLTPSLHLDLPWTLYYTVDVTTTSTGPCADNPLRFCTTSETHPEDHQEQHLDTVDVTLTFTPATYAWDFGDGLPGSRQMFPAQVGIGRSYTDTRSASPVAWTYQFDSRDVAGGFPVSATLTWNVSQHVVANSDVGGGFAETSGMPDRNITWATDLLVCQVQALRVAPMAQIHPLPCAEPGG
jgi:hypothetical protein